MIYLFLILLLACIYKTSEASPFLKTDYGYRSIIGVPSLFVKTDGSFGICKHSDCIYGNVYPEILSIKGINHVKLNVFRKNKYYSITAVGEVILKGKGFQLNFKSRGLYNEMIWIIKPELNPKDVKVTLKNVRDLYIDKEGNLIIRTDHGVFVKSKPVAWQYTSYGKIYLDVKYVVHNNTYGFDIKIFDPLKPIYIDPVIRFVNFGGSKNESAINLVRDKKGNIYTVGYTTSEDWNSLSLDMKPKNVFSSWDIFVAKFDENLNLKSVAVIGGSKEEWGRSITIDEEGYVYICGWTHSSDLPVTDLSYKKKDADVFVAKLDPDLRRIIHLKYIGGDEYEYAYDLKYYNGYIYVVGETASSDFPVTEDAYDTTYNGGTIDIFVMKMDKNLNILASTFIGGKEGDAPLTMDVDREGIYIGGLTWSPDLPVTQDAFDSSYADSYDGFVAVLDLDLKHLKALTYIGGKAPDSITSLKVHGNKIIVGGKTFSPDFPTTRNVLKRVIFKEGMSDGFVSILTKDLKKLVTSTLIGGIRGDEVSSVYPMSDYIILTGATASEDFPVTGDAFKENLGGDADGFFMIVDYNLRNIYFSTFIGKETYDIATKVVGDGKRFYISGWSIPLPRNEDVQAFIALVEPDLSVFTGKTVLLSLLTVFFWFTLITGVFYYLRR